MIGITSASASKSAPAWHETFLKMLPAIRLHARISFRDFDPERRAELVQNAICSACAAVARLAELNKLDLCYPSVLAAYAVAQTKDGRMLGRRLNCKDITSEYCQARKGVVIERLDRYDHVEESWEEVLVPDRTCTPAELAASRIDVPAWLTSLDRRSRRIARFLAQGNNTGEAAQKFRLSKARISQMRRELKAAWDRFTGQADLSRPTAASA